MQKVLEELLSLPKEKIIEQTLLGEGAVVGAAREALVQVMPKAIGLNVGGKVGIARKGEHLVVAVFLP